MNEVIAELLEEQSEFIGEVVDQSRKALSNLALIISDDFFDIPRNKSDEFQVEGLSYSVEYLDSELVALGLSSVNLIYIAHKWKDGSRKYLGRIAYEVLDAQSEKIKIVFISQAALPYIKTDIAVFEQGQLIALLSNKLSSVTLSELVSETED